MIAEHSCVQLLEQVALSLVNCDPHVKTIVHDLVSAMTMSQILTWISSFNQQRTI